MVFSCPCLDLHFLQARGRYAGLAPVCVDATAVVEEELVCVLLERRLQVVCVLASLTIEVVRGSVCQHLATLPPTMANAPRQARAA